MKTRFLLLIAAILRSLLKARYRVTITGTELLRAEGPALVLPNHVALTDPVILTAFFARDRILCPLVSETYYSMPAFRPLFRLVDAVPIADLQRWAGADGISASIAAVSEALDQGKSILMYPAGQIYLQGFESVVGKKAAHAVVSSLPENARVLTVRTTGLWGSMFGKAFTGSSPNLLRVVPRAVAAIVLNAFAFLAKREVRIEIEDRTDELRKKAAESLQAFNSDLEAWYNRYGKEHCRFVRYFPVLDRTEGKTEPEAIAGSLADLMKAASAGVAEKETLDAVLAEVAEVKSEEGIVAGADSNLILDLHCDSLDLAELKTRVQKRFPNASNPPISSLKTVLDLALMAEGKIGGEDAGKPCQWNAKPGTVLEPPKDGKDAVRAIVRTLRKSPADPFLFDELSGMASRFSVLMRAVVVAGRIQKIEEGRIAVMLPASSGAAVVLLGAFLAGKTPVMLNWTVGAAAFEHCLKNGGASKILTSRRFFEKAVPDALREKFGKDCLFLEDLLSGVTGWEKIRSAAIAAFGPVRASSADETAVVLFTSGSESLPKTVALTWKNIVSDIWGALRVMPVGSGDVLFSFLPVFHSFGFTIGTLLPLLTGLKTAYSPDPNDGRTVANLMAKTSATLLASTPTFFRLALEASGPGAFASLRKLVVGAEKCPRDLFERLERDYPEVEILEGYGITECSPVLSINPPGKTKPGSVGIAIEGAEIRVFPLDGGQEPCAPGVQGMIYARGPNVFSGYGDGSVASPFEAVGGAEWYKTGDLGYLDVHGYLWITGRLKRFVKIAGEMVSLPAMEVVLAAAYPSASGAPELAVEASEEDGNVRIVCFSVREIPLSEANAALRSGGAGGIAKLDECRKIDAIPVLGTGKTDYKHLKSLI